MRVDPFHSYPICFIHYTLIDIHLKFFAFHTSHRIFHTHLLSTTYPASLCIYPT